MNGSIFPENYFIEGYGFKNSFENIIAINFNHRWLATFTFIIIMTFVIYLYLSKKFIKHNTKLLLIFVFGCLQFLLGILALLSNVNIIYANLHQINSMLFLGSIILIYHAVKRGNIL